MKMFEAKELCLECELYNLGHLADFCFNEIMIGCFAALPKYVEGSVVKAEEDCDSE